MARYFIGCSGWWYKDWDGKFYPSGLKERMRLPYYAKHFNTVEVNVTFYRLPEIGTIRSWVSKTPSYFLFAVKVPKDITHGMHLLYSERKMTKFLKTIAPLRRAGKLGPLLFQCPPEFVMTKRTLDRLRDFLSSLPEGYEYAVEFRHKSWLREETFNILEEHQVAYVIVDEPYLPPLIRITASFTYVRFHGRGRRVWYYYDYKREELEAWARRIREEVEPYAGKIYIYFNNHFRSFAPKNASEFIEILGLRRMDLGLAPLQVGLARFMKNKKT